VILLALETTCDETAAAVVTDDCQVLGAALASQDLLHARFSGVVPELAARAHVERILPVIDEALRRAGLELARIDAVAVATTPGLAGSLLVGLAAAKALAVALDRPLVAVNHLHAHIYACRLAYGPEVFPCVALVASGGHTHLYDCRGPLDLTLLGGTIDDAAGEAFDKAAALLGLGYPGGPAVEQAARRGNPGAYHFPRTFANEPRRLQFSFSGLKTALRYVVQPPGGTPLAPEQLAMVRDDLAASFQEAVVDVLVAKCGHALEHTGRPTLCVGGGVAANGRLRTRLEELAGSRGIRLYVAPRELCTDNAVMGALAAERLRAGQHDALDLDIEAGLLR
jgi:N6-L-threonylcarbamoyladenine synthase